jgi:hypothetical protein
VEALTDKVEAAGIIEIQEASNIVSNNASPKSTTVASNVTITTPSTVTPESPNEINSIEAEIEDVINGIDELLACGINDSTSIRKYSNVVTDASCEC